VYNGRLQQQHCFDCFRIDETIPHTNRDRLTAAGNLIIDVSAKARSSRKISVRYLTRIVFVARFAYYQNNCESNKYCKKEEQKYICQVWTERLLLYKVINIFLYIGTVLQTLVPPDKI